MSQCGNDAKYSARASVAKSIAGGTRQSSDVSSPQSVAIARSRSRRSAAASPRNAVTPGATSHSSPRARSAFTMSSRCRIVVSGNRTGAGERVGDVPHRAEVIHANARVGNAHVQRVLRPRDELQNANGVDESIGEERRVGIDGDAGGNERRVDPRTVRTTNVA